MNDFAFNLQYQNGHDVSELENFYYVFKIPKHTKSAKKHHNSITKQSPPENL